MHNDSLATIDLQEWINARLKEVRTLTFTFANYTAYWEIEWWCFEARQIYNLPPQSGYVAYTGIVVGGTKSAPGQVQVAQVNAKVIGEFTDCGLVGLTNRSTGERRPTFNFTDHTAPPGKYYQNPSYGIKDGVGADAGKLLWDFSGELSDGTTIKREGVIA